MKLQLRSPAEKERAILRRVQGSSTNGKLGKDEKLQRGPTVLLSAKTSQHEQLFAGINSRQGARAFCTFLGLPEDFQQPHFRQLLVNAIFWVANRTPRELEK